MLPVTFHVGRLDFEREDRSPNQRVPVLFEGGKYIRICIFCDIEH